ncbi:MAG: DUF4190 domain-containing protein [Cellulomonadaceae bacterium]
MSGTNPEDNPYRVSEGGAPGPGLPRYGAQDPAQPTGTPAAPGQGPANPYGGAPYGPPGSYGYGGYPTGGYPPGGYVSYPDNGLAGWSLGLAVAGFFLCGFFTSIPAIVLGVKARRAVARGTANNGGLALAGLIIGWIVTVINVAALIFFAAMILWGPFWNEFDVEGSYDAAAGLVRLAAV